MQIFQKFNTVFYRLIFSYIVLIILTAILTGMTSYIYFTSNFNREIERVNSRMLGYVQNMADENVFRKAQKIYLELTVSQYQNRDLLHLFDHPVKGNHARVRNVYRQLQEIVSINSSFVRSIQVFYRHNQMMISSNDGVDYLNENRSQQPSRYAWLDEIDSRIGRSYGWVNLDDTVTLIGSYPYANEGRSKGYLAIHVDKSALSLLLADKISDQGGKMVILDRQSRIVAEEMDHEDQGMILPEKMRSAILASEQPSHFFTVDIDGQRTIVSYTTLESNGWKLVNMTPVDQFYSKSAAVRNAVLLIALAAILIGVVISHIFTFNIYSPLRSILDRTRKWFQESPDAPSGNRNWNEYRALNRVIDNLSVKVHELEETLRGHFPVIKSRLVEDLLTGKIRNPGELREKTELLELEAFWEGRHLQVLCFQPDESELEKLNVENSEFVKYNLIDCLESYRKRALRCMAVERDNRIFVIVSAERPSDEAVKDLIHYLSSHAYSNFMISVATAAGNWTKQPSGIAQSFREAEISMQYHYFRPELKVFHARDWVWRDESDKTMDETVFDELNKALKSGNRQRIGQLISAFFEQLRTGPYNARYCHEKLQDLVYVYYRIVKELNYSTREILPASLQDELSRIQDVARFEQWFHSVVEKTMDFIEEKLNSKPRDVVEKVKSYCTEHLHEDLSLNAVAEVVHLSPRYLSRVFKQETGINFVDFVTRERMDRAKRLIRETEENIEQIAAKVGYHNPAYFAKKFRETFGYTPTAFRQKE